MSRSTMLAALVAAFSLSAAAAEAPDYQIVLDRPLEAGALYRAVSKGTNVEKLVVAVDGTVVQETSTETVVELDAKVEIVAVGEGGRASKAMLTIVSCAAERNGARSELFPAGTQLLLAMGDDGDLWSVGGEPVAPDVAKLLKLVNGIPAGDESDDAVFGTKERKRVGDSWPIDTARAAESFREPGLTIADDGVSGEARLVAVKKAGGVEAMTVEATMVMEGIGLEMPPGFEVVEGRLDAKFVGTFPLDVRRARLDETMTGSMLMVAKGSGSPGGPPATLEATGTRTRRSTFTRP